MLVISQNQKPTFEGQAFSKEVMNSFEETLKCEMENQLKDSNVGVKRFGIFDELLQEKKLHFSVCKATRMSLRNVANRFSGKPDGDTFALHNTYFVWSFDHLERFQLEF